MPPFENVVASKSVLVTPEQMTCGLRSANEYCIQVLLYSKSTQMAIIFIVNFSPSFFALRRMEFIANVTFAMNPIRRKATQLHTLQIYTLTTTKHGGSQ